jgi:hypothetical protein
MMQSHADIGGRAGRTIWSAGAKQGTDLGHVALKKGFKAMLA